jgi:hypothetical protein
MHRLILEGPVYLLRGCSNLFTARRLFDDIPELQEPIQALNINLAEIGKRFGRGWMGTVHTPYVARVQPSATTKATDVNVVTSLVRDVPLEHFNGLDGRGLG